MPRSFVELLALLILISFFCFVVVVYSLSKVTVVWSTNDPTRVVFACRKPPFNLNYSFSAATNGTFFDTRTGYLASFVFYGNKRLGEFPVTQAKVRGGVIVLKSGEVLFGYFIIKNGKLLFGLKPFDGLEFFSSFAEFTHLAMTGGGLVLDNGIVHKNFWKVESLPKYIAENKHFSFIALTKDKKLIGGVCHGLTPVQLAQQKQDEWIFILRLDGGSQTRSFKGRLIGNNAVGL